MGVGFRGAGGFRRDVCFFELGVGVVLGRFEFGEGGLDFSCEA